MTKRKPLAPKSPLAGVKWEYKATLGDKLGANVGIYSTDNGRLHKIYATMGILLEIGEASYPGCQCAAERRRICTTHMSWENLIDEISNIPQSPCWEQKLIEDARVNRRTLVKVSGEEPSEALKIYAMRYAMQFRGLARKFSAQFDGFMKEHPDYF